MAYREYIGSRYVPIFGRKGETTTDWDNSAPYEPLTVVTYQGNSYISRQYVPSGIDIADTMYWIMTGNFNAQLQEYINQVQTFNTRIQNNTNGIATINDALPIADFDANNTVKDAIDDLGALLPANQFTSASTVKDAIDALDTAIDARFDVIEADSWVTGNRIANNAVTSGKIADGAVTGAKIADGAVTNAKIADGAVTNAKIANRAVLPQHNAQPVILVLGDSWSAFDEGFENWSAIVANYMTGNNLEGIQIVNYAVGGTGWYHIGGTNVVRQGNFTDQLEYAYNHMTDSQKERIMAIIAIGGVNDLNTTASYDLQSCYNNVKSALGAFRTKADTCFPHVPVYAGFNAPLYNWKDAAFARKCISLDCLLQGKLQEYGMIPIRNMNLALAAKAGYRSDHLHPNTTGAKIIGDIILATLKGSGYDVTLSGAVTNWEIATGITVNWYFSLKNYTLELNFETIGYSGSSATGVNDVTIPNSGWGNIINLLKLIDNRHFNIQFSGAGATQGWYAVTDSMITFYKVADGTYYAPPIIINLGALIVTD